MPRSYRDLEDTLVKELHLYHHPVAVTFLFTDDDVSRFKEATPHVTPARPLTYCQWELAARMEGKTVVGEKKHMGCNNARITFGWKDIDEDDVNAMTDEHMPVEAAEMFLHTKPRLPLGSIKAVAAGPLGEAAVIPDVVHFYCDNIQSHYLAAAYMRSQLKHPLRPMICESSAACGGGVFSFQEQSFNLTPCCKGSYNSGKTERGEVNVFIPAAHLESTVRCLPDVIRKNTGGMFPGANICKNCAVILFK